MKKIILTVVTVFFLYSNVMAQYRWFDAGIILGHPTGVSFALWNPDNSGGKTFTRRRHSAANSWDYSDNTHRASRKTEYTYEEPTRLPGNRSASALAGAIGWSVTDDNKFHIHLDYLSYRYDLFNPEEVKCLVYNGIGGRIETVEDNTYAGVRFPFGLDYLIPNTHVYTFVEIVPIMDLSPETEFRIQGAIGVRYAFGLNGKK